MGSLKAPDAFDPTLHAGETAKSFDLYIRQWKRWYNADCRQLKDNIALQGMKQIVKEPTRTTKDSQTLIDVILTNRPDNLCSANVILSSLSDHDIIGCKRKINNIKMSDIIINCREYKNYDPTKINAELCSTDRQSVYQTTNVYIAWRALKDILTK